MIFFDVFVYYYLYLKKPCNKTILLKYYKMIKILNIYNMKMLNIMIIVKYVMYINWICKIKKVINMIKCIMICNSKHYLFKIMLIKINV